MFSLLEQNGVNKIVVGLYLYAAVHPDDLGFKKGEKMKILEEWVSPRNVTHEKQSFKKNAIFSFLDFIYSIKKYEYFLKITVIISRLIGSN